MIDYKYKGTVYEVGYTVDGNRHGQFDIGDLWIENPNNEYDYFWEDELPLSVQADIILLVQKDIESSKLDLVMDNEEENYLKAINYN